MSEAKHTPTPWRVETTKQLRERLGDVADRYNIIQRGQLAISAGRRSALAVVWAEVEEERDAEGEANAAFIVRAVNAHHELIRAINALLPFVDDAMDVHSVMSESAVTEACRTAVAMAREALAKAEPL